MGPVNSGKIDAAYYTSIRHQGLGIRNNNCLDQSRECFLGWPRPAILMDLALVLVRLKLVAFWLTVLSQ